VAIETLVVYNVANYDAVTEFFQGHQQARQRRAEMYRHARKIARMGMNIYLPRETALTHDHVTEKHRMNIFY
jgi:hypothetical protein